MRGLEKGFIFVVGNMFGSKSSEMIHLLSREESMGRKTQAFMVPWDNRYGVGKIRTHHGTEYPAFQVENTAGLIKILNQDTEVIGIDEVQFFDEAIKDFILENRDKYLIIATALQMDFRGNPFPLRGPKGKEHDSKIHVGHLMPYGKIITRYPQCTYRENNELCREEAIYIQRFRPDGSLAPKNDPTVVVGGKDMYEPRCMKHFKIPG